MSFAIIHHIMTHSIKKFIPVLFLILCSLKLSAQYPVQIIPQLIGPYSLTLSDYYSGTAPKLSLIITNRDLQSPALSVILKINISSSVVQIKSVDNALYVPIILDAGIPYRVSQNEMETYFNPNNLIFQGIDRSQYIVNKKLPEGLYNFCFEVLSLAGLRRRTRRPLHAPLRLFEPDLGDAPDAHRHAGDRSGSGGPGAVR